MTTHGLRPGVHGVLVTPFLPDETLDEASLRSLIDSYQAAGADGVLVLGDMGEADRLADREREQVAAVAIAHAAGRLQVTVGVSHQATVVTAARARVAARAGADAVMVAPPVGSSAGVALRDHFRRVADGLPIPIVVQDHPPSSGVKLPIDFIAGLAEVLPPHSAVKLEDPPPAPKMAALLAQTGAFQVLGAYGGLTLLQELDAGADGVMTGFVLPETLVRIVRAYRAGDRARARHLFEQVLPLIVLDSQPGVGAALRKEVLRRRGVIAHATIRQPAAAPDPMMLAALDDLLATLVATPV